MSRGDKVVLAELQRLAARRMAEVQRAVWALETALEACEQSEALRRTWWPEARRGPTNATRVVRDALEVLRGREMYAKTAGNKID